MLAIPSLVSLSSDDQSLFQHLRDGDGGASRAEVALGGDDLVVVLAELKTSIGPSLEVSGHVDGTADALVLADRPVLLEGPRSLNGRGVDARADAELVVAAVSIDRALVLRARRGVVRAPVLDDVVLDERVGGPSIDGKVRVAVGRVLAGVVDGATEVISIIQSKNSED